MGHLLVVELHSCLPPPPPPPSRGLGSGLTKTYFWVMRALEGKLPFESVAAQMRFIVTWWYYSLYSF